jgi:hypothetical protein
VWYVGSSGDWLDQGKLSAVLEAVDLVAADGTLEDKLEVDANDPTLVTLMENATIASTDMVEVPVGVTLAVPNGKRITVQSDGRHSHVLGHHQYYQNRVYGCRDRRRGVFRS